MRLSKPAKVGVITFSDGRPEVDRELREVNLDFQAKLIQRLSEQGYQVVSFDRPVWDYETCRNEAQKISEAGCDCVVFHYAIWSFPHLSILASRLIDVPVILFSNVNPRYSGMVAMLSVAGGLEQIGRAYERAWGDIDDPAVLNKIRSFVGAARATRRMCGMTFGLIGGRPMGMYSAVSNPNEVMRTFGVDIQHIDQLELVDRAKKIDDSKARRAVEWLEGSAKAVHYDGQRLTPDLLARQVKFYYALRDIVADEKLDFCGIKAQPELTDRYCTMDVAEAFMNDPYDWDGPHEPIVCATEADTDGALSMQLLHQISGAPVLFSDVRHYNAELDVFDLVNSGAHATFFATGTTDAAANLAQTQFYPATMFFPGGGASVHHIAAPGEATFARFTRKRDRYVLTVIPAEIVRFDEHTDEKLVQETQVEWPHAFVRFECRASTFLESYRSNHIHGVYGDYANDLLMAARMWGLECEALV